MWHLQEKEKEMILSTHPSVEAKKENSSHIRRNIHGLKMLYVYINTMQNSFS